MPQIFFLTTIKYIIIALVGAAIIVTALEYNEGDALIPIAAGAVIADVVTTVLCLRKGYSERNLLYLCTKQLGKHVGIASIAASYVAIIGVMSYIGQFHEAMGVIVIINGYGAMHNARYIIAERNAARKTKREMNTI